MAQAKLASIPDIYLPQCCGPWAEDMAHRLSGDAIMLLGLLLQSGRTTKSSGY
jgi:hypothetical protein